MGTKILPMTNEEVSILELKRKKKVAIFSNINFGMLQKKIA